MSRRAKIWMAVAVVFTLGNVAGGVYAAALGEWMHAGLHAALTVVGMLAVMLLGRERARGTASGGAHDISAAPSEISDRLSNLEHSVDAVAIEVERIGEGQRFMTRVLTQTDAQPEAGASAPAVRSDMRSPVSPSGSSSRTREP